MACLGTLPENINAGLVKSGHWLPDITFSDFVKIQRLSATGSISDLVARTGHESPVSTPRQMSMTSLSYAGTASSSIRSDRPVLPNSQFAKHDAGPNILVACSPGSADDLALLWNLRAAHGDFYAAPIGIPSAELSARALQELVANPGLAHHGFSASNLYVTSLSLSVDSMRDSLGHMSSVSVRHPAELLMFGSVHGLTREEVLVWREGRTSYKPMETGQHRDTVSQRNINGLLMMHFDVSVVDAPLPISDDYRVSPINGAFYNNSHTAWSSPRSAETMLPLEWPSRAVIAHSLASIRGFELNESAPGIAARILVDMLGDIHDSHMLCHAPLLKLLESMAARQGFNWYKQRLRQAGVEALPTESVPGSIDELPEKSFHDFKRSLGNSDGATKYWLAWAERSSVIIKGFPIQCPKCGARQWIPVADFAPPITCRGCVSSIDFPFGDRPMIDFKYRLSEQARRVYESDAMGHILVSRYFASLFGQGSQSRLIGLHPGMSVRRPGEAQDVGEADLLMLTRRGEFVPIEVKRTATGLTEQEIKKLDTLVGALKSPWSGVVACQYAHDTAEALGTLSTRNTDGTHDRIVLTYDNLLQPHPIWALGDDPFERMELDENSIVQREKEFVTSLATRAKETNVDWLAYSMTRRQTGTHSSPPSNGLREE